KLDVTSSGKISLSDGRGKDVDMSSVAWNIFGQGASTLPKDEVREDGKAQPQNLSLYGPTGKVVKNDVRQGDYNNCFFLSCVWGAMNSLGDSYVTNMIKQTGANTFQVTFPNHSPVDVTVTPTEASMYSYVTNGGCYLTVLALAADKVVLSHTGGDTK